MNKRCILIIAGISIAALFLRTSAAFPQTSPTVPTFYPDVLPVLQKHCQNCHRPGEMAFPLITYGQAAPRAQAIRESVATKKMPPWLADPDCGHFLNDPSLSQNEIKTLAMWANGGARAGNTYEVVPTRFREDRWVQMAELRPSSRAHVHHAVVYIRPPGSKWLRNAPVGVPFTTATLKDERGRRDTYWTDSDILLIYAPGSSPEIWASGMAKFIPAGSD